MMKLFDCLLWGAAIITTLLMVSLFAKVIFLIWVTN